MSNLKNSHIDTIQITAQQDTTLIHQAVKLKEMLEWSVSDFKKTNLSIACINLQRQIGAFMRTFGRYSSQNFHESDNRGLERPRIDQSQLSKDLIQLIVKFQEGINNCIYRHDSLDLNVSVGKLNKSLNKFLTLYSKYAAQQGTGPVDKPADHEVISEHDM